MCDNFLKSEYNNHLKMQYLLAYLNYFIVFFYKKYFKYQSLCDYVYYL